MGRRATMVPAAIGAAGALPGELRPPVGRTAKGFVRQDSAVCATALAYRGLLALPPFVFTLLRLPDL